MLPLIVLRNVDAHVRPRNIVQPFLSFGLPKRVHRGRGWWAIEMESPVDAADAVWVVERHMERLAPYLGANVGVAYAGEFPDEAYTSKNVSGSVYQ
jgi:hypothetical protein